MEQEQLRPDLGEPRYEAHGDVRGFSRGGLAFLYAVAHGDPRAGEPDIEILPEQEHR